MDIWRCGEPLLRLTSSPLFPLLAPSLYSSSHIRCSGAIRFRRPLEFFTSSSTKSASRPFTSTSHYPSQSAAAAPKPEEPDDTPPQDPLAGLFGKEQTRENQPDDSQKPAPRATPWGSARSATQTNGDMNSRLNARMDELFPRKPDGAGQTSLSSRSDGLKSGSIVSSMLLPQSQLPLSNSQSATNAPPARRAKRTLRSRPMVGRTIEVEPKAGTDLGAAMRKLDILLAVNKVRREQQRQRFHERGGLRRKRLKSERWRRYFKSAFDAAVDRVKLMKKQGW